MPEGLDTDFTATAVDAAAFVVYIPSDDMVEAANVIEQARPDVLVYLALGLAHQTYALARRRLARVVLVFGHGHPLTSGLDTVDYFVSSESYERDPTWPNRGASERHAINAEAAVFFDDDSMVLGASSDADDAARKAAGLAPDYGATGATLRLDAASPRGDGAQKYEEQLVLFEHSSIGFDEPPAPPYSTRADLDLPENAPVFCVLQHSKTTSRFRRGPLQCSRKGPRGLHFVVGGRADACATLQSITRRGRSGTTHLPAAHGSQRSCRSYPSATRSWTRTPGAGGSRSSSP